MASRLELQRRLVEFLGSDNVYFEPTESFQLNFPCIVYKGAGGYRKDADNTLYRYIPKYSITFIGEESGFDELGTDDSSPVPNSSLIERFLKAFPYADYDRSFVVDNLYHDVFTLYF